MKCTDRWDLARKLDGLGDGNDAFLYGAVEVDIVDLFAEVYLGGDKANQAILDLQIDVRAVADPFVDSADCLYDEVSATRSIS